MSVYLFLKIRMLNLYERVCGSPPPLFFFGPQWSIDQLKFFLNDTCYCCSATLLFDHFNVWSKFFLNSVCKYADQPGTKPSAPTRSEWSKAYLFFFFFCVSILFLKSIHSWFPLFLMETTLEYSEFSLSFWERPNCFLFLFFTFTIFEPPPPPIHENY